MDSVHKIVTVTAICFAVTARLSKNPLAVFPGLSSGGCVQGVKTPCAFNKTGFSNFQRKFEKRTAGRKFFFDTLKNSLPEKFGRLFFYFDQP